ncbi:hypothetical protein [Methylobacterium nodulans]|uniref:hypothetical protein n=1 Tax=Methylobacterium nodulans TaxID=114616 RepID=UPI0005C253B2|nr:hypothetical protein [Methylobacterium nodulans]
MSGRRPRRTKHREVCVPRRILYAVDVLDAYMPCDGLPANDNVAMRRLRPVDRRRRSPGVFLRIVPAPESGGEARLAP